jgi:threonyl-tRNA synthetase
MRELQARHGYEEVSTPILVSHRVWQTSGHWDHYRDNMFVLDIEGQPYSLKPMNCPESTFIYRSRVRSYRDLPLRYAEYGRLHRNERSGTLSGLTRVRQFIQDDGHVYVRPDQLTDEIAGLLEMVREAYGWFGLEPRYTFATRPDDAIGEAALWERAEGYIRDALDAAGVSYRTKPKDGTFYAPKIDIYIDDALGREWQMATIQADLTMLPERFDLHYVDEQGQPQRPIAIHRAVYGSLERFIGILVEHFAGAFPFWCAPLQAVVIPIADRHVTAARELAGALTGAGLQVTVDESSNRMQNKIRLAQEQKVPYMLVLGDREVEARTATVRPRAAAAGEPQESVGWEELATRFTALAASRRPD